MKNMCRRLAEKVAQNVLGCELIPKWRLERLAQTAYLSKLLDSMQIDCIFDVGANQGQYRDYLRYQVGYTGLIISFEPNPDCSRNLLRLAETDAKWKVTPIALGDSVGQLEFNVMKDSQFSSFLKPKHSDLLAGSRGNVVEKIIPVEVNTLDRLYPDLVERLKFARPLLKLDTQGYELNVLRGAGSCISSFCAVQAELSNVAIYDGITGMAAATEALAALNFNLAHIFPTNADHFPVIIDFDAYFINFDKL